MRKFTDKKITITKKCTTDVLCNKCGKSMIAPGKVFDDVCDPCISGVSFIADFCFGSSKDGTLEEFHLCDNCYDLIVSQFIIPTTKLDYPYIY